MRFEGAQGFQGAIVTRICEIFRWIQGVGSDFRRSFEEDYGAQGDLREVFNGFRKVSGRFREVSKGFERLKDSCRDV